MRSAYGLAVSVSGKSPLGMVGGNPAGNQQKVVAPPGRVCAKAIGIVNPRTLSRTIKGTRERRRIAHDRIRGSDLDKPRPKRARTDPQCRSWGMRGQGNSRIRAGRILKNVLVPHVLMRDGVLGSFVLHVGGVGGVEGVCAGAAYDGAGEAIEILQGSVVTFGGVEIVGFCAEFLVVGMSLGGGGEERGGEGWNCAGARGRGG